MNVQTGLNRVGELLQGAHYAAVIGALVVALVIWGAKQESRLSETEVAIGRLEQRISGLEQQQIPSVRDRSIEVANRLTILDQREAAVDVTVASRIDEMTRRLNDLTNTMVEANRTDAVVYERQQATMRRVDALESWRRRSDFPSGQMAPTAPP